MRLRGAVDGGPHAGGSALRSRGFDENVPPVHLDGIRVAAVVGSELETCAVAARSDGVGADASKHLDGVCRVPARQVVVWTQGAPWWLIQAPWGWLRGLVVVGACR
jgi:hypothetical protein